MMRRLLWMEESAVPARFWQERTHTVRAQSEGGQRIANQTLDELDLALSKDDPNMFVRLVRITTRQLGELG